MPHTNLSNLTAEDLARFQAVRKAAATVARHFGPYFAKRPQVTVLFRDDASTEQKNVIPEAALRAGAQGVRLLYMVSENTHVDKVIDTLAKLRDPDIESHSAHVMDVWKRALRGNIVLSYDGNVYDAKQTLDTWLYARAFHQDDSRQEAARHLADSGVLAILSLQETLLQLGGCVINLDAAIAYVLGEESVDLTFPDQPDVFF